MAGLQNRAFRPLHPNECTMKQPVGAENTLTTKSQPDFILDGLSMLRDTAARLSEDCEEIEFRLFGQHFAPVEAPDDEPNRPPQGFLELVLEGLGTLTSQLNELRERLGETKARIGAK